MSPRRDIFYAYSPCRLWWKMSPRRDIFYTYNPCRLWRKVISFIGEEIIISISSMHGCVMAAGHALWRRLLLSSSLVAMRSRTHWRTRRMLLSLLVSMRWRTGERLGCLSLLLLVVEAIESTDQNSADGRWIRT